ncbi:HD domain-containing protein [Bacillus massiliigorillae]|uniref:HD domain-containing protein n=1 Tax=Bacillus massiliigorillae TaxID=1243664 RepID=UPI0003A3868D|nr:HD domain-containing protein [Bacillus massiliigorillae]
MNQSEMIRLTEEFVFELLSDEASGHDWWHIHRVTSLAKTIAEKEGADLFICEMAALLHDVADEKLNSSEESGISKVRQWLRSLQVDGESSKHIIEIITTMSFKGGGQPPVKTLEGKVVQDADRLDAIGAVGIARVFAFSGAKGQLIYDPTIPVREQLTKEEYRKQKTTAINHFYEKLLKLKGLMNTSYGKQMAEQRHAFMEEYLKTFLGEWQGIR